MVASIPPPALQAYRDGVAAQHETAYADAVVHYDRALGLRPRFRAAASRRASCSTFLGDEMSGDERARRYQQAIDGYKAALQWQAGHLPIFPGDDYDPENDHFGLGYAYEMLRRFSEAKAEYDVYIAARPDDAGAILRRANMLWKMGQLSDAEAAYRQALASFPFFVEARNNLAQLLVVTNKSAASEALIKTTLHDPNGQWLVAPVPEPWGLYDTLATAYLAMATQFGNDDLLADALAALDQARSGLVLSPGSNPGDAPSQALATIELRRGYCLAKRNRLQEARGALTQALRLSSTYSEVQLAASRNMQLLPPNTVRLLQVPVQILGMAVAVIAFAVLIFSCVALIRSQLDSAGFATVVVSSLGGVLLGFSLPRLASFKLGGAEATLSQQVVLKTTFELTEIAPPSG